MLRPPGRDDPDHHQDEAGRRRHHVPDAVGRRGLRLIAEEREVDAQPLLGESADENETQPETDDLGAACCRVPAPWHAGTPPLDDTDDQSRGRPDRHDRRQEPHDRARCHACEVPAGPGLQRDERADRLHRAHGQCRRHGGDHVPAHPMARGAGARPPRGGDEQHAGHDCAEQRHRYQGEALLQQGADRQRGLHGEQCERHCAHAEALPQPRHRSRRRARVLPVLVVEHHVRHAAPHVVERPSLP